MRLLPAILFFSVFFTGIAAGVEQEVNPTGGHSNQKVINDAIDNVANSGGGIVYLNSGTYIVDGPVMMRSDIKLTGDSSAVIKVYSGSSQWFQGSIGIISNAENLHNVEICNFQVDGSVTELPPGYHQSRSDTAHDCERCILFAGDSGNMMDNVGIHDMTLFDSFSDGVYIRFCDNAHIYNNFISNTQHEGVFLTCNKYSLIESNRVAGITSDCLRLDNCQNCEVRSNLCFSYNGTHASNTYIHGESGIQVGNSGVSHGYDGRNKPFYTLNIFVHDNSFINNGLNAVVIDDGLTNANIYFTNNTIIGHKDLETSGFPINSIGNYSYEHPPTLQQSEQIFSSIFDVLNLKYADNGFTNQTSDAIQYTVQQTDQGAIAGGIKIVGFSNVVSIDCNSYIPDNKSILVKYAAGRAPSFDFLSGGVSNITSTVNTSIVNGTAYATLTVKMESYTVSTNSKTKKSVKNYHVTTATFNDSCKSPDVLDRPKNVSGIIYQYPTFFMVSVPSQGLTKIHYEYAGNSTEHIFLIGSRNYTSNNIEFTDFSSLEHWEGELQHSGNWLYVLGEFDKSKFNVIASTPYESLTVSGFNITKFNYPKTIIANWFYPELAFLAISFIFGKWLFNQMKYR